MFNVYAVSFAALIANSALAFTLNGTDSNIKGWNKKEIVFRLNPTNCPANVDGLLDEAIDIWNTVPSSNLRVRKGDYTDITVAEIMTGTSTEMPAIVCSTNVAEAGLDPSAIPGAAMAFRVGADSHINYGYIVINAQDGAAANVANIDAARVKVVLAHEIGHVLGFGHSDITDALMYYDVTAKKEIALAQDDVDVITYLYPRDEFADDQLLGGCATIGAKASHASLLVLLALLLVPLMFVAMSRSVKLGR